MTKPTHRGRFLPVILHFAFCIYTVGASPHPTTNHFRFAKRTSDARPYASTIIP